MNAMNDSREWRVTFGLVVFLSVVRCLDSAADHVDPREESGEFTLYNHGEIGKYNGYKGMLVAMYRVPRDVQVGTWMMKVKPDPDGCSPKRQIHIHLQAGSMPLVNALGESFPPDFILRRFSSQHRLQVANDGANRFLNITNPEPGQWFLIAYYIDEDTSIKQEGLTVNCASILIAGLQFRFLVRIPELVLNDVDDEGLDERTFQMTAKRKTMLFKFHIPQTVIFYSISVVNCTTSSSSTSDEPYNCPLNLTSRASALPYTDYEHYNATSTSSSIGMNDDPPLAKSCADSHLVLDSKNQTHCALVNEHPVRGAWHYLNITRTDDADSTVAFVLQLTGQDCFDLYVSPDADASSRRKNATADDDAAANATATTPPPTTMTTAKMTTTMTLESLESLIGDSNATSSSNSSSSRMGGGRMMFLFCPDQVEALFKTEKENHFEYSFYPLEDLTVVSTRTSSARRPGCPGLCVRDTDISFHSLSIDPRDDIGGTLKIAISFEDMVHLTKAGRSQRQILDICLTKDSTLLRSGKSVIGGGDDDDNEDDDGHCERGLHLDLDSEDEKKREILKWIPYPEPGTYFFKFSLRCVDKGTGDQVPCAPITVMNHGIVFNGAVLKFNVSSNACIERECGRYGSCNIAYFDKVQFSYCVCDSALGYRGYGCTELGPNAPSAIILILNVVFLVGSNVAFLAAIFVALKRGFYLEAVVYFGVLFFSTFYHACDQPLYNFCIFEDVRKSYDLLQFMDFVTALFALWVTILAVAEFPLRFKLPMVTLGAILVPAMTFLLQTILVPLGVSIAITAISWIVKCRRSRRCFPRQHYSLLHILPGVICGASGIVCFTQANEQNYYIIHSLWHVLMATAIACLLPCVNKAGRVNSHAQTDDEDDDDEDDVCRRVGESSALNNDTDSSTASGNGNGNGGSGGGVIAGLFSANNNSNSSNSNNSSLPINAVSGNSAGARNAGFESTAASSSAASLLGRMLSREEGESPP